MKQKRFLLNIFIFMIFLGSVWSSENDIKKNIINVTASSSETGFDPGFAVDGDITTRWTSRSRDNEWIKFEFSKSFEIRSIGIRWEIAAAYSYKILLSNDDNKWETAAEITGGWEGEYRKINFTKSYIAKFVMIECNERATNWGFSIWEVEFNNEVLEDGYTASPIIKGDKFFTIKKINNIYWFVDPDGKLFISRGVSVVLPKDESVKPNSEYYDVTKKFKNKKEWAKNTIKRLKKWNFNTIGCWSDINTYYFDFPFTYILYAPVSGDHRLVDVFDERFDKNVDKIIRQQCDRFINSKYLIGYFIENELPWYGDVGWYTGHVTNLLDIYMKLSPYSAGKKALVDFFKEKYNNSIDKFNEIWDTDFKKFDDILELYFLVKQKGRSNEDREEFAGKVAERYFQVITSIIRKYDSNHLIMGGRFAGSAPKKVLEACGKYSDIISFNYYLKDMHFQKQELDNIFYAAKKPILITEFSYRAMENNSNDKNTHGADVTVKTQKDRAVGFEKYVTQAMNFPYIIGYHWFEYFDQSPQGRSFGDENSNYGILDIHDNEYKVLTKKMKKINKISGELHKRASIPYPGTYYDPKEGFAKVENIRKKNIMEALFCNLKKIKINDINKWGDSSGFSVMLEKKADVILAKFDSGQGWGCGLSISPTLIPLNSDRSANLQGYNLIEIEMVAPVNVGFYIYLDESGADTPDKLSHKGVKGADGESFATSINFGTGKLEKYILNLNEFRVRMEWGNQKGNKTLNLQAIKSLNIHIPGKNGAGVIEIRKVKLK